MGNVFIRGIEMPAKARGVTIEIEDDFIVFINTVLSPKVQAEAVQHELIHIRSNHFYKDDFVVLDERQATEL